MILHCVSPYRGTIDHLKCEEGGFRAGDEINVSDEVAEFLLRSSPGSFVRDGEPIPDVIAAAPNRMAKGGNKR